MQPIRLKQVINAIAAVGLTVGTAIITTALVTSLRIGSSGSTVDNLVSVSQSIDVNSISAASATSSVVSVAGTSVGDTCEVTVTDGDFLSTTSTGRVSCRISASGSATIVFTNTSGTAAFNAGNSTFRILSLSF